ncbi:MAG TPA: ferritin-like domain-containing protein [Acetobacteraceae bacterium]
MNKARAPGGVADGPVEQQLRDTDGLPGKRAALPAGTLPGLPPDPQADENRDPPPVTQSGAGPYRRTVDLAQNNVTPAGKRQRRTADPIELSTLADKELEVSGTSDKARDVFIVGLRNQHAVENQAIELLERQIGRLENYPEMVERMRQHLEESKEQARRIEDLLSQLGTSHSTVKETAMSLMGNLMAIGHTMAGDEVVKNTLANYAFEHYEMAAYIGLLTLADVVGHPGANTALNQSLREEEAMAQWIGDHIGPTVLRFVERSKAGVKAGV